MTPTTSRPSQIDRLIADLQATDSVRQAAAVARLRVLGTRALSRLAAFIESSGPSDGRALAVAALEGAPDPRAAEIALAALAAPDDETTIAALGVLRGWVAQETSTRILEAVTSIALDPGRDARIRVAAVDALADLPDHLIDPIREQAPPPETAGPALDDPVAAREWVEAHGTRATLSKLHDAVKSFGEHESTARSRASRQEWLKARGAVHLALAQRGSRVALYDAKEAFGATRGPLPPGFLEAISALGDASCLEPLARAWSAAPAGSEWRGQLSAAARHLVRRARLTGRSAIVRDIRASREGFL